MSVRHDVVDFLAMAESRRHQMSGTEPAIAMTRCSLPTSTFEALRARSTRFWLEAAGWALTTALIVAIPTVLVRNPMFTRMTPTRWWDYVFLAISAPLIGLTMAFRRHIETRDCPIERRSLAGAALVFLAVGCPVCNKLVVALLGVGGALAYFAPAQPVLGALSVLLAFSTLLLALRSASRRLPVGRA